MVKYMLAKYIYWVHKNNDEPMVDVIDPSKIDYDTWLKSNYRGYTVVPFIGPPIITEGRCFAIVERSGFLSCKVISLYADLKDAEEQLSSIFNVDDPSGTKNMKSLQGLKIVSGYVNGDINYGFPL